MADNFQPGNALIATIQSIAGVFMAWISIAEMQIVLACIATVIAILSGALAARYYWYAAQEKRQIIKQNKIKSNGSSI